MTIHELIQSPLAKCYPRNYVKPKPIKFRAGRFLTAKETKARQQELLQILLEQRQGH